MKRLASAALRVALSVALSVASSALSDTSAWVAWTRAHHFPITSIVTRPADDFTDLQFFKDVIGDRRLVQLGESGHGVAEFDSAKVRLIKFFHEQMGFDVIAFESSIYECFAANRGSTTGAGMLLSSIFTVWAADEVVPLFDYILATQTTGHPLILAGFDTQISSVRGLAGRPPFFRRVVAAVDADYADQVAAFDTDFVNRTRSDPSKYDEAERFYDRLDSFLGENRDKLAEALPGDPAPWIAARTAHSMVLYMRQLRASAARPNDPGPEGGSAIRDAGMADNLTALASELYPDRKILIWAHNFHVRYANAATASVQRTMGSFLIDRFRPELYTIGLYMNQGTAALNDRSIYVIRPAPTGSMEWVLAKHRPGGAVRRPPAPNRRARQRVDV